MNRKAIILTLLAIFLFISFISVFALFGQGHVWINISQSGNQVPCEKCHANIVAEFDAMPSGAAHKNESCEYCHRSDPDITYASGQDPYGGSGYLTPGEEAHAASIPACEMCHSPVNTENITSVNETHKPLYEKATLNEACIMCHTGFDKKMSFTRPLYIEYDISNDNGNWTVQNFDLYSNNETIIYSNQSGDKHTFSNNDCFDCHSDVKNALESGGHVPRSSNSSQGQAGEGHQGRMHDFDRSDVTINSCMPCHLVNTSNFGNGYTHEGHAQLDYHAATTEHCYNCHYNSTPDPGSSPGCSGSGSCHTKLKSGDHDDILYSMFLQDFCQYKIDKVCIGCHGSGDPYSPEPFDDRHFEVYTEPNTTIIIT